MNKDDYKEPIVENLDRLYFRLGTVQELELRRKQKASGNATIRVDPLPNMVFYQNETIEYEKQIFVPLRLFLDRLEFKPYYDFLYGDIMIDALNKIKNMTGVFPVREIINNS